MPIWRCPLKLSRVSFVGTIRWACFCDSCRRFFTKSPQMNQYEKGGLKATLNLALSSRRNLGGYILKVISYRCSGLTYEGNFKFSIFLIIFLSIYSFRDGSTKIVKFIGSFKVLLGRLDFFDASRHTFLDSFLQRGESFGKMLIKFMNIKKLIGVVIMPPDIELVST